MGMWSPENRSLGGERWAAAVALIAPGGSGTKVNVVFRSAVRVGTGIWLSRGSLNRSALAASRFTLFRHDMCTWRKHAI